MHTNICIITAPFLILLHHINRVQLWLSIPCEHHYSGLVDVITSTRGFLFKAHHHAALCCIQLFINTLCCQTRQPNVSNFFLSFFYIFCFKQASKCCQKKVLFSFGLKPQHNTLWIRTIPTTVSMVCYMYTIIHQHTCLLNKHQNVELCLLFNWSTIILPTFGLPQFVFVQHHISFLLFTWHQPQKSGVSKPHKLADKRCFQPGFARGWDWLLLLPCNQIVSAPIVNLTDAANLIEGLHLKAFYFILSHWVFWSN